MNDDVDASSVILRVDSDPELARNRHLKLAPDGVTVLVPQPNEDPHNPVCFAPSLLLLALLILELSWPLA
jgi:hypothetical protein